MKGGTGTVQSSNFKKKNLRRRVVAPEGELPIGIVEGNIVEFVGGANGGLIVDGGGEGPYPDRRAKGRGGAWEAAEG